LVEYTEDIIRYVERYEYDIKPGDLVRIVNTHNFEYTEKRKGLIGKVVAIKAETEYPYKVDIEGFETRGLPSKRSEFYRSELVKINSWKQKI